MPELIIQLKALADETRLKIVKLLLTHDLCVGAIARKLGISKAAVSQHMKVLREANLVKGTKRGYWTHYEVNCGQLKRFANRISRLASEENRPKHPCFRTVTTTKTFNELKIQERRLEEMCKCCCEHPDKLKGKPEECSTEQIKECHGETKDHPCVSKKEE